jgi:hypothetical protein
MIKRKGKSQIPTLESKGQMRFDCDVLYTVGKNFLRVIRYFPHIIKINLIRKKYELSKFWGPKKKFNIIM